jgi:GT2 family glycosyltransferase/glycosyltransferase involved in cell wall biosynthesis
MTAISPYVEPTPAPAPRATQPDSSDASTVPTIDGEALRLALAAFLSSDQRLTLGWANPKVSVVIPVHGRADLTLRCLRSLAAATVPLQVVIVDNASSDATSRLLDRLDGPTILRNNSNEGFLAATNQGAAAATADLLLLLNNDTELPPQSLVAAIDTLESSPSIGAVVAKLVHFDGRLQEAGSIIWRDGSCQGYGRGETPARPAFMFRRDVDFGSAAFLLTRRQTFEALEGFDLRYKPAYYEDADFCVRLWQAGLRVVFEPRAMVRHAEFGSAADADALTQQGERHAIFVDRHRAWLERGAPPRGTSVWRARHRNREGRQILFIEDRIPHARLGSGYPRALALTKAVLELGHHITVFPLLVPQEPWEEAFSDVPREAELWLGGGAAALARLMEARGTDYDAVIISRPHNMRVARHALPIGDRRPAVIYDAEALFALRELGRRRLRGVNVELDAAKQLVADEVALAEKSDLVLTVSDLERQYFVDHGIKNAMVLGHSVAATPTPAPFAARGSVLFVGAFTDKLAPNTDSMQWFARDVLPHLKTRLGDAIRCVVAGRDADRMLAGFDRSLALAGVVDDLTPLYDEARVFIAPTRFAAGLPLKVYEAAAFGVPIVASSVVAAQVGWRDGVDLLVADDAEQFATHCAALYTDETLWSRLRASALERVANECAPDRFRTTLARALVVAQRARAGDITTGVAPHSESASS